ncbi:MULTISPECIES: PilW family protein [Aeromonas]|jgi:prepilin-type N-terminal cleavage/methylation domain-containing protein|uniref:PilW family protein n=1 Tax=Aeromonas TaxID=642 RepID=UPI000D691C33|nr:prepilin-type N-terminal cleavage/methylation domain-containing protein [Aeromonas caviae]MBP4058636.1 prepilin-type N-terminal cleavage/methylation domain-containing protein [Aeromonas sp. Prich7-2]MCR3985017.1 prepilin-type N-terminal cleavage/methylation domain-containing protein [Aeromonas caviae]MDU7780261.1 prepilin-type N-terminal cleavage/methylation domain-containing protein [Aeromonas caviae]MDX7673378.1 prepilin-type N-terminal cleavage/methylation domain-containing protein [Aerom
MLRRHAGFSLVELMVSMVAGLLLVAAVTTLFATILRANGTAMKVSRLNQEVQAITDMMARDIERAGYDASAATSTRLASGALPSPFYFDASTDLMDETATGSNIYRCIRISYDDNENGVLNNSPSSSLETRLYSYSSTDKGVKLATGASPTCNSGSLISTDNTIEITQLTYRLLSSSQVSGARAIQLNISGRYKDNTELTLNLQRDIKLRNDGY